MSVVILLIQALKDHILKQHENKQL